MFISMHIPKTAGTTLGHIFDHGSERRIMYDYKGDYSNAIVLDEELYLKHKEFIEKKFDFIHGHFYLTKYKRVFPDAKYITCFRDPLKRIVSQYNHILHEKNLNSPIYKLIKNDGLTLVDFARLPNIANAQSIHMNGLGLSALDFFFLTEELKVGLQLFDRKFSTSFSHGAVPMINTAEQRSSSKVLPSQSDISEIVSLAKDDYSLYEAAKKEFAHMAQ